MISFEAVHLNTKCTKIAFRETESIFSMRAFNGRPGQMGGVGLGMTVLRGLYFQGRIEMWNKLRRNEWLYGFQEAEK